MARYCQNLITLEVAACSNLTDGSFYTLAAACFRLERMDLEECIHITDNTLLQLSIHCPHIKGKGRHALAHNLMFFMISELTLSHCENLTDQGIEYISKSELTESLETIDLDNCPLLTDLTISLLTKCKKLTSVGLGNGFKILEIYFKRINMVL